jgi:hypothetical protein
VGDVTHGVVGAPTYRLSLRARSLFPFRRGPISPQSPIPDSSQSAGSSDYLFAILPLKISHRFLLSLPPFPRCDHCPALHPSMPFVFVLSFLKYVCPPHRSLIRILLRSYCFRPRFFMPFLHSGPLKHLFPSVRPFRVLGAMSSFLCLCSLCSLPRATFAQRVVLVPAAANSLHGPQFSWVPIFLKMFLFRNATVAQQAIFLQAAANFFQYPQSLRVSSFGSPRRPAAGFLALCRFFRPLTGSLRRLPERPLNISLQIP